MLLHQMIDQAAQRRPEAPAIRCDGATLTSTLERNPPHTLGLGFVQAMNRRRQRMPRFKKLSGTLPYRVAAWAVTMLFVSALSGFANSASFPAGLALWRTLAGLV